MTTTATESYYTVDQYDREEREWFILALRIDQAEAHRIFDTRKGGDRTRIQRWNGTAWITTRDTNTEKDAQHQFRSQAKFEDLHAVRMAGVVTDKN